MERSRDFILDCVKEMSAEQKSKVEGYFPAIASSKLSSMEAVGDVGFSFDVACTGSDRNLYLYCLVDAMVLACSTASDSICVCLEESRVLAGLLGYSREGSRVCSPVEVLQQFGYEGFEVSRQEMSEDQWDGVFEEPDEEDLGVVSIEDAPADEDIVVSETSEDLEEVVQEHDDSTEADRDKYDDIDKELDRCFGGTIPNYVSKLLNTFDLLYASGYDLRRPHGVLGAEGVYYVDSDNHCSVRSGGTVMDFGTSVKMYSLFQNRLGFKEKSCRSLGVIGLEIVSQYMSNPSVPLYFPMKCLEIMFGRVPATAKKEANGEKIVYFSRSEYINSWSKYSSLVLKPHLTQMLSQCVKYFVQNTGIAENMRTLSAVDAVNGLLDYAVSCLSSGVFVIDYKASSGLPVKFKVRVSDPMNKLGTSDYTTAIINTVFSGNVGGLESKKMSSGLNKQLSAEYRVYEYAHEFNHRLSNATPLFAYKALEALNARGEKPNWDTAIIGQAMDDTILRNGSGGINLAGSLFHHINAGSRSGKGVMTLNMVASGIASNKALFYFDNKVDMGSMLSSLAHGGSKRVYPSMFVVNGSNFEKDDFGEFSRRNDWILEENIPQEVRTLFGSSSWETLGELFYLRAYMLSLGIIFARGSDSNGKADDPMFGGQDGLMVVVDEINQVQTRMLEKASIMADVVPPLESEYQNRVDAIKSAVSDEKEASKLPKLLRSFKRQFNASAYYALSLLKSYGDCIQSIKYKSFSGFRDSEARVSDIFIIGQNLEPIPVGDLNDILKTSRYKNESDVGLNKMSTGGNRVRTQSIPYQMTLFKSADAFIGYNVAQPAYLKQTDPNSNAFGVLDKVARGFAYIPSFEPVKDGEKPADQFCSREKANNPSTVYFKPYLILNQSDMDSSYVTEMFKYAYAEGAGATKEQVIAEYPDDRDPTKLNKGVGFTEYIGMMGIDNIQGRLSRGADIANHVVKNYLGYEGRLGSPIPLWLQFITDLRVEWMFSPQDVWAMCTGNSEYNLGKGSKSKITGEYYQYVEDLAELQLMGVDITDNSLTPSMLSGEGKYSKDDIERFEIQAGLSSKEDGSFPEEEYSEEQERLADAMGDFSSEFNESELLGDSGIKDSVLENLIGGEEGTCLNPSGSVGYSAVTEAVSSANMQAIKDAMRVLNSNGYRVSLDMGSYSVSPEGTIKTDFSPADSQADLGSLFEGSDFEQGSNQEEAFQDIVNSITKKVIADYGGLQRIKSFAIVGDSLVINRVMYRCKIDKSIADTLFVDLRREVNAGNIIRLFNYKVLAGMTELVELKCDSASFMREYVNHSAFGSSSVPYEAYFKALPQLGVLQIGKHKISREEIDKAESEALYYSQTSCSKFLDSVHELSRKANSGTWSWGKSKLTDKNSRWYQKVLWTTVVLSALGATAATRGVTAGVASAKTAYDKSKAKRENSARVDSFVKSLKRGFSAATDGIKELFEE